jgi:hypothetical protein
MNWPEFETLRDLVVAVNAFVRVVAQYVVSDKFLTEFMLHVRGAEQT